MLCDMGPSLTGLRQRNGLAGWRSWSLGRWVAVLAAVTAVGVIGGVSATLLERRSPALAMVGLLIAFVILLELRWLGSELRWSWVPRRRRRDDREPLPPS